MHRVFTAGFALTLLLALGLTQGCNGALLPAAPVVPSTQPIGAAASPAVLSSSQPAAPGGASAALPTRTPALSGTLTKLTAPSGTQAGSALVEAQTSAQGGRKVVGAFNATTRVFDLRGGGTKAAALTDLKEGQRVELWLPVDGVCAESYPEQCAADTLAILADS